MRFDSTNDFIDQGHGKFSSRISEDVMSLDDLRDLENPNTGFMAKTVLELQYSGSECMSANESDDERHSGICR
jgi:hypothetical protein